MPINTDNVQAMTCGWRINPAGTAAWCVQTAVPGSNPARCVEHGGTDEVRKPGVLCKHLSNPDGQGCEGKRGCWREDTRMNTFGIQRPPLLRRLGWKLLPPTRLGFIGPAALPDDVADMITVVTEIRLGFKDRLRVFFQGRLLVKSVTLTEHKPGHVETLSGISTE